MKGKRKTAHPCAVCFLHQDRCICHLIPSLKLSTRICLVIHAKELKRTTNTGRLAIQALTNSEMKVRGEGRESLDLSDCLTGAYRTFLFYPSEEAVELNADLLAQDSRPIQLIVPDGNWRQASKVNTRHPELKEVVRVKISHIPQALEVMRQESKESGMATLEAIARALYIIEGAEVGERLMALYQAKLKATLQGRGVL